MAGEPRSTSVGAWLAHHMESAPDALAARVWDYARRVAGRTDVAAALAAAGNAALASVLTRQGDRSVALDLLAADALVTFALLAEAETAPDQLGRFADGLLRMHLPTR